MKSYEADGNVWEALTRLDADPGLTCTVLLAAMDSEVKLRKGEEPGTYHATLCTHGEPSAENVVTPLQLAAILNPLVRQNERLLQLQGALLAAEIAKYLGAS